MTRDPRRSCACRRFRPPWTWRAPPLLSQIGSRVCFVATADVGTCPCPLRTWTVQAKSDFLGADLSSEMAQGVAEGTLNPADYLPYSTSAPSLSLLPAAQGMVTRLPHESLLLAGAAQLAVAAKFRCLRDRTRHSDHRENNQSLLTFAKEKENCEFAARPPQLAATLHSSSRARGGAAMNPVVTSQQSEGGLSTSRFFGAPAPDGSACPKNPSGGTDFSVHESPQPLGANFQGNKRPSPTAEPAEPMPRRKFCDPSSQHVGRHAKAKFLVSHVRQWNACHGCSI